jgi:ABC-type Mn2+/Zn2+ transport system ATPase subunit
VIEGNLYFMKNKINLIVGPTGSGKTSMLHALLGEMHFVAPEPASYFNLPRQGGIAYAAQKSWVQNETIKVRASEDHNKTLTNEKKNILFDTPLDEERYKKGALTSRFSKRRGIS